MEQRQLQVWIFILFALFLTRKTVAAIDNAQNSYSRNESLMSTVPVPDSPSDDFQDMLDYLNQTMPKDGCDNPKDCDNYSKYKGSPPKNQPISKQSPVVSNDSLNNTSSVYSGNEASHVGSYIRAGFTIASTILLVHFFL